MPKGLRVSEKMCALHRYISHSSDPSGKGKVSSSVSLTCKATDHPPRLVCFELTRWVIFLLVFCKVHSAQAAGIYCLPAHVSRATRRRERGLLSGVLWRAPCPLKSEGLSSREF